MASFSLPSEFHFGSIGPLHPEVTWQPAVDLYRCADGWIVKFELAGVRQEDIEVRIQSDGITVIGSRLDRTPFDVREPHLIEISYSRFERFVVLPEAISRANYHASFHDGMLYVHILKDMSARTE